MVLAIVAGICIGVALGVAGCLVYFTKKFKYTK